MKTPNCLNTETNVQQTIPVHKLIYMKLVIAHFKTKVYLKKKPSMKKIKKKY